MVGVIKTGAYLFDGREIVEDRPENAALLGWRLAGELPGGELSTGKLSTGKLPAGKRDPAEAGRRGTMTYGVLAAHHQGGGDPEQGLRLRFDALASHDITFVNIIQTARVSGLTRFPLPYILTNCHNSLCAVGGTINEDDHLFGLSAAEKYGGIYVPPHLAVIHSYMRETRAGCGMMILGSDSHTRYGALGTLAVGEGGGELVKQLLGQTYDFAYPRVIAVYLTGKPQNGVGPQDVALALIRTVFASGFVKNSVLEFVGDGVGGLSVDFRSALDVMTTETTCWSSLWETDGPVRDYLALHGRAGDYRPLYPGKIAYYDGLIRVDLAAIKPMIALPFHPSNAFVIDDFLENSGDILARVEKEGRELIPNPDLRLDLISKVEGPRRVRLDQGIIAGCAGGSFENIMAAAAILGGESPGNGAFSLSVYPGSQPVLLELAKNGAMSRLIAAGVVVRTAFCGPCFGAGDVPAQGGLSIRHSTRNFPNREGSRPMDGQIASVALMDARSIAATARNGGLLCSARGLVPEEGEAPVYHYDDSPYRNRVYNGFGRPRGEVSLRFGPNISDWPPMEALGEDLLVSVAAFIEDPVTTTDEIIPSGETSSYRSNPVGLAEFTLSRKDPGYVGRAKALRRAEEARLRGRGKRAGQGAGPEDPVAVLPELGELLGVIRGLPGFEDASLARIQIGSAIYAVKPGDGSAREQAASCQRVLGGAANFAREYATKRYRGNLINWGIIPFLWEGTPPFDRGDYVFIPGIARGIRENAPRIGVYVIKAGKALPVSLALPELTPAERETLLAGCLINYNRRAAGLEDPGL
jgi:aconitate hydratase